MTSANLPLPALALLGMALAAAAAYALSRPASGAPAPDLAGLEVRAGLALRRFLALFRRDRGAAWYRWGLAVAGRELAVACLEQAARLDHSEAHFELGMFYEEGGQGPGGRDRAARHYRAAADLGHLEAAYRLADLLRWGIGPARDPGAAHRWYLRSAHGGFRPAMDWLVRAFEFGEGVAEDLEKAVYWTVQANAQPAVPLRISHFTGRSSVGRPGPAADGERAPAPARADGEACFRLGMGFLGGAPEHRRDPIAARIWLLRAAEAGHVQAMAELADLLANGVGGLAHSEEARIWFQRAGRAGHAGAQIRLGQLQAPEPAPR